MGVAATSALASSTAGSSVSDSIATSVGSVSDSIKKSSDSSSKGRDVAEGDYQIIDVAEVPERPGTVRMALQAVATPGADGAFMLYLPRKALDAAGGPAALKAGAIVTARQRPYGLEFAAAQTRQAFFLVLEDGWYKELQSHPVVL
jgi:hypothetical protein